MSELSPPRGGARALFLILGLGLSALPVDAVAASGRKPSAPAALQGTAVTSKQIVLHWRDRSSNERGFTLERSLTGNRFHRVATLRAGSTRFTDKRLNPGTTYAYRIRAFNSSGSSRYSNVIYTLAVAGSTSRGQRVRSTAPARPTNLAAAAPSAGLIVLTWGDASSNEDGFKIERSLDGTHFTQIATMPTGSTRFVDSGLNGGTTYAYRIRSYNAAGASAYTGIVYRIASGGASNPPPVSTPAPQPTVVNGGSFPVHPQKALWEQNMLTYGRKYCDPAQIASLSTWEGNVWYYDGTRVFMQIGDYTGDASWYTCAKYVRDLYRNYVLSTTPMPGWRLFPHGLAEDYLRNNDTQSREAVRRLAQTSAFATQGGGASHELSRETAYLINSYLKAEDVGFGRQAMLATAVNYALGHLDQWTGSKSAPFVKPFMMGLTFEALIGYHDHTGDARVLPAIQQAAEWLWNNMWSPSMQAFPYILCRGPTTNTECSTDHTGEGPDLNLLIVPAFGWLYRHTGDVKWIQRGDQIFAGGVKQAWLGNGKQFSQNYRWSFEYLKYRDGK